MDRERLLKKISAEIDRNKALHDAHTGDHNEAVRDVLRGVEIGLRTALDLVFFSDLVEASQMTTYSVFNDRPASSLGTFVPKGSAQ